MPSRQYERSPYSLLILEIELRDLERRRLLLRWSVDLAQTARARVAARKALWNDKTASIEGPRLNGR
jgi:hypothetical protein